MSPVEERFDEQTALAYLEHLVREFAGNRMATGQALRDLLTVTPDLFLNASWKVLKKGDFSAGHRFLATLLVQNDNLVEKLCDPSYFNRQEAIAIARHAVQVDPLFDTKLARYLGAARATPLDDRVSGQLLEVLDAVSEGTRLVPILSYLVNSPDARLRSKAALLVGRRLQNPKWTWKRLEEVDGRVRANAVEALWGVDTKDARTVLWQACEDSNNRVAGNALYGLYRLDELAAIPRLLAMAASPEPAFRATAAWVMGHTADPRFIEALGAAGKQDDSPLVRKTSFFALMKVNQASARAATGERFELRVLRAGKRDDGARSLWVAAWTPEGIPASGLSKTAFVVRQGSHPLVCSDVREVAAPQSLVAGFGLCREHGLSDQDMQAAEQGVLACLRFKRKSDQWAVAKVRPVGESLDFSWQGKAESAQEASTPDEPVRLIAANSALGKVVTSSSVRVTGNSAAGAALERLLGVATPAGVPRHIILLINAASSGLGNVAVPGIRVPLHVIQAGSGPTAGNVASLAAESGGFFICASSPEEIVDAYQRIYLSFLHHYELDFEDGAEAGGKVQIFTSQGYSEASW